MSNEHKCERWEPDYCLCSVASLEPHDECPFHGHGGIWPPRCVCGKFVKWEPISEMIAEEETE